MNLNEILKNVRNSDFERLGEINDVEVHGLSYDSRLINSGDLFFCFKGEKKDSHDFVYDAIKGGASALVVERKIDIDFPQVISSSSRKMMSEIAEIFYEFPSREITTVGVTGTNGKTTTVNILSAIAKVAGEKTETIGTLTGQLTTPEAPDLQRQIRDSIGNGVSFLAMEVSSHALLQNRISRMTYDAAIFTNLSLDHLDYHGDMESYYKAKSSLFSPTHSKLAVINADNQFGKRLMNEVEIPQVSFSLNDVDIVERTLIKTTFRWKGKIIELKLPGVFNLENALAAAVTAEALGFNREVIAKGLESAKGTPGRFELLTHSDEEPYVIVDYCHTPDGLEKILLSINELLPGARTHIVFGCGGDRDTSKRAQMGMISETHATNVYLTSDNPRSEDQMAIINDILAGIHDTEPVYVNPDRREAIFHAVTTANQDDVVLIAGKGCEPYQEISGTLHPFLDSDVGREALEARR
ncbi:MAG: UDP-N-acetylmuramoyl-L-alanyl-D-glutamate--2,6-diaminopimelate ligase [Actinobacteria bacterium]|nr:UDP-N-acetylmuramoyl-L-alanyl-D-glutamate--2,6-diaminopimelate ligase [Actinomycetota bacterium]